MSFKVKRAGFAHFLLKRRHETRARPRLAEPQLGFTLRRSERTVSRFDHTSINTTLCTWVWASVSQRLAKVFIPFELFHISVM